MHAPRWPAPLVAALLLAACGEGSPPAGASAASAAAPSAAAQAAVAAPAAKGECASPESCVKAMLAAADPPDRAALSQAEGSLRKMNRTAKGDGAKARELLAKGRAALGKDNDPAGRDLLRQAAAADPTDVEILDNLAIAYIRANDFAAAGKAIHAGLTVDPAYAELWNSLSLLLTVSGTKDEAARALLVAYAYEKDPKAALAQWEANLGSMRGDSREVFSKAIGKVKAAGGAR